MFGCLNVIYDWRFIDMSTENTNWEQSVAGVVIKDNKVLLARHTYGNGKGMLIIPGGYVNYGETPQQALKREYMEETKIEVEPQNIIGVRFNMHDWYIVFSAKYISGKAQSDNDENSEVLWLDIDYALSRDDVPELTKKMIESAALKQYGLQYADYNANTKHAPFSLYMATNPDCD
jgi:ADP-ribose pyrophosphatase YjhB (NUDIX family)